MKNLSISHKFICVSLRAIFLLTQHKARALSVWYNSLLVFFKVNCIKSSVVPGYTLTVNKAYSFYYIFLSYYSLVRKHFISFQKIIRDLYCNAWRLAYWDRACSTTFSKNVLSIIVILHRQPVLPFEFVEQKGWHLVRVRNWSNNNIINVCRWLA